MDEETQQTPPKKKRPIYSHSYEVLRREEQRLHREMRRAPTPEARDAKYQAWLQVRQAKRRKVRPAPKDSPACPP